MILNLRNVSSSELILCELLFREAGESSDNRDIEYNDRHTWGNDTDTQLNLLNGNLVLSVDLVDFEANKAINFLKDNQVTEVSALVSSQPAFSAKVLPDGSKLFRRKHGFSFTIPANSNSEHTLTVPYIHAKINEFEICNANISSTLDLKVYDSIVGDYQQSLGVPAGSVNPDLMLNQFGFGVNMPEGFHSDISKYDADVYYGMRIKIKYYNNTSEEKTIYGNIVYHEVV